MKPGPSGLPTAAASIIKTLRSAGHQAYLAGGCVRDQLLGRLSQDYDIATSAEPKQVAALFKRSEPVGAAFGVTLVIEDGEAYEVATFRKDGTYSDGRRPDSVSFATPEEDAKRRDFTVNGMFMDSETGELLDFVDGQLDLGHKTIRAIGDPAKRFSEDRLRVLRAVRFAVQLGFEIEARTWEQVKAFASQLGPLASERVQTELTKILTSDDPRRGLELLESSGLAAALLPELKSLKGCTQPPQFHPEGDVWVHTLMVMQALRKPSPALAWAGLLHDIAKPATWSQAEGDRIRFNGHESEGAAIAEAICKRLKMSGDLSASVVRLVADHLRLNPIKSMKLSTLKRLLRRPDIFEMLELHRADCLASHGDLELYDYAVAKLKEFQEAEAGLALAPTPLLDGKDLIALGHSPGPRFKAILEALEDEQLELRLTTKESALEFVKKNFPAP